MKLCRFELKAAPGDIKSGIVYGGKIYETDGNEPVAVHEAEVVRPLLPFVPPSVRVYPTVGQRDVDRWSDSDLEPAPFFYANAATLHGPSEIVAFPEFSAEVDWASYLGVVIAEHGRNIPVDEADGYVLGLTIANLVIARDIALRDEGVGLAYGRGHDIGISVGPVVSTPDDVADLGEDTNHGVVYRLECTSKVNAVERRRGNTGELPYTVAQYISFASQSSPLRPGDLLLIGPVVAPDETRLEPGDTIQNSIENLGTLSLQIAP